MKKIVVIFILRIYYYFHRIYLFPFENVWHLDCCPERELSRDKKHATCSKTQFQCMDGKCIDSKYLCNGFKVKKWRIQLFSNAINDTNFIIDHTTCRNALQAKMKMIVQNRMWKPVAEVNSNVQVIVVFLVLGFVMAVTTVRTMRSTVFSLAAHVHQINFFVRIRSSAFQSINGEFWIKN